MAALVGVDECRSNSATDAQSPLTGLKVKDGKRKLVIGQDARCDVELYRFVLQIGTVFVLALRSQQEPGFPNGR